MRSLKSLNAPGWVSPEPLNVAPALVGQPLARPSRRAWAMGVDLLLVALLSGVSGLWLLGGLALVLLQLRSRRGTTTGPRLVVGWLGAGLLALLALNAAQDAWQERQRPEPVSATAFEDGDEDPAAVARRARALKARRKAEAARASASAVSAVLAAASSPAAVASAAEAAASAIASSVAANASAPEVEAEAGPEQRIAELEAEVARLKKAAQPRTATRVLKDTLEALGASFGWGIVYFSLLPAWWGGQTVGKKLFGLRVVELTGKPMTVMRCLKRYGGYAAGMATGGLGFLQMLWDPNRQALQDRAAHTAVLDLRAAAAVPAAVEAATEPPAA